MSDLVERLRNEPGNFILDEAAEEIERLTAELNQYNDQIQQTSIKNWLQATADDAMGMEPGDRAMANEALKRIEQLEGVVEDFRQFAAWADISIYRKTEKYASFFDRLAALEKTDG